MNLLHQHSDFIKKEASRLGFTHCRIAKAQPLDDDARRLEQWLHKGLHGSMHYMEKYFDLRVDPSRLVPSARSVITLLCNYFPAEQQQSIAPRISRYAYGKDYHEVIKGKLNTLLASLQENIGEINGRGFVDSAPVLERAWAQKSGLGWIGKNGNLINKQGGSFFFIATLITDLELVYDDPFPSDHCGTCTRCIEACPTQAILPGKVIDGSRCISYYTIELKDALFPGDMKGKFDNWVFGCDTCQDVCPWNRFSKPTEEKAFAPIPEILNLSSSEWEQMTEDRFKKVFRDSPLRRTKFTGMMRNIRFVSTNS